MLLTLDFFYSQNNFVSLCLLHLSFSIQIGEKKNHVKGVEKCKKMKGVYIIIYS